MGARAPQITEILLPPCAHPDFAHGFLCPGATIAGHQGKGSLFRDGEKGLRAKLLTRTRPRANPNLNPKANRSSPTEFEAYLGSRSGC